MTKWSTIAKHEYTYNIRRKEFLFITFGLPLFIFAIGILPVLLMSSTTNEEYRIGYVDKTGLFSSMNFTAYTDEEIAKKDLSDNKITHFFVIPANYIATGKIAIYSSSKTSIESQTMIENQIKSALLDNMLKGESRDTVERAKNPINSEYFSLNEKGVSSEEKGFTINLVPIAFAILFVLSIFTSSGFLLQGVVEEKENRIIEVLLSSVPYRELLIGKIFGLGAVGLTQVLMWFLVGITLLSSNPTALAGLLDKVYVSIPMLVFASIYFSLGYLIFASIMAGVGAVATTSREGQQMAGIFTITGSIPLVISQFITTNPNAVLARVLGYFPLTSPIVMIMRLSTTEVPLYEIVISILILAASTIVVIELSVRIFRASLLMYGKKPTLREVIKYVFEK